MIDDERLKELLRDALKPEPRRAAPQDLWTLIEARGHAPVRWSWLDLGIAAVIAAALLMEPAWLWGLAYHL